ncbi:MAG: hypothetical protein WKF34_05880 [Pyrinomonadaceae bacterium]
MKKIVICCSFVMALHVVFATGALAQILKTKPDAAISKIVVADSRFGIQKSIPILSTKPQIGYEVWITTDGVLHCKTSSTLKSASIYFTPPSVTSTPDANGNTTGSGGGYGRKFELNKSAAGDEYVFNVAPDKYKEKHAITLSVTSTSGAKADIKLINKKVPAAITK